MASIFKTKAQKEARLEYLVDYLGRNGYGIVACDDNGRKYVKPDSVPVSARPKSIQELFDEVTKLREELAQHVNLYDVLVKLDSTLGSYGMEFDGMFCRWPHVNVGAEGDDTALDGTIDEENYFYFTKADLMASTYADGKFTANGVEIAFFKVEQVEF